MQKAPRDQRIIDFWRKKWDLQKADKDCHEVMQQINDSSLDDELPENIVKLVLLRQNYDKCLKEASESAIVFNKLYLELFKK